jgi:hypothetical protein
MRRYARRTPAVAVLSPLCGCRSAAQIAESTVDFPATLKKARTTPQQPRRKTYMGFCFRGWIEADELPDTPRANAVRADIMDRLRQHEKEDTLPRGPRGLFYDLRPRGIVGNSRGVTYTKHPQARGKSHANMEADPNYVQQQLAYMRRVFDPKTREWLINEDWIADARTPNPVEPSEVPDAADAAETVTNYLANLHLFRQSRTNCLLGTALRSGGLNAAHRPHSATVRRHGLFRRRYGRSETEERSGRARSGAQRANHYRTHRRF